MKITLQSNVNPDEILRSRGLGSNNKVNRFIASEVKRLSDPYVPLQSGVLARVSAKITSNGKHLIYNAPYAHYQYEGEVYGPNIPIGEGQYISPPHKSPTGKKIKYHGAPMRGAHWDKRMMADRGKEIEESTEAYMKSLGG